jgi:ethanolamine utilization protein EutQ (cupin superfamily)
LRFEAVLEGRVAVDGEAEFLAAGFGDVRHIDSGSDVERRRI